MKQLLLLMTICCVTLLANPIISNAQEWPTGVIGGLQHAGAVHFYMQPGTLNVTLYKRDSAGTGSADRTMKAFLCGPDGTVLDKLVLPSAQLEDGKSGPLQQGQLQAKIKRAGIYTLLVTMNQDQYVRLVSWGFSTNADKFVINADTGHTDVRRQEAIMLNGEMKPFSIFFQPPKCAFNLDISRLPEIAKTVEMFDASGQLVQSVDVENGEAKSTFVANAGNRDGVWELRLPVERGTILIDGFNQNWTRDETVLPVWSTSREHYFDLADYHWLLQPRRFARQLSSGDKGVIEFSVYNHSQTPMALELSIDDAPKNSKIQVTPSKVLLSPGAEQTVQLHYQLSQNLPDADYDFHLTARDTQTNQQAFSLIELRVGQQPDVHAEVKLPIELQLYSHDQFQFAYEPQYPRETQFYFDADNRPWMITAEGLKVLLNGQWKTAQLPGGNLATDSYPGASFGNPASTIGTDKNGFVYAIVNREKIPYLLRASSKSLNAQLTPLPAGGNYMMETYMGGKVSDYPPVVLRYIVNSKENTTFWSRRNQLEMFIPAMENNKLQISDPIVITDNCVGMAAHSGIVNPVAADGENLYIIWGATSDPKGKDPGVPTFTSTYNRKAQTLSAPILLAYAPPVNDVHNMSTLLVDSKGGRHVIIGSHGEPFQYLYTKPGSDEWTQPEKMSDLGQTYVGAILNNQDRIDMFCRTWQHGKDFPGRFNAGLYFQQMDADNHWKPAAPFAEVPLPGYAVFYHRLTVDRTGRAYLSFSYWSTWAAYRESFRNAGERRAAGADRLFFSSADGQHWNLLTNQEMESRIIK
jgi:hypothetical protein